VRRESATAGANPARRTRRSSSRIRWLVAGLLLAAWGPVMAVDEPRYTVIRTEPAFEVRRYEKYVIAETIVGASAEDAGNDGFRILAAYIFGGNQGSRSIEMTAPVAQTPVQIAMTAPVAQAADAGGYAVRFAMPHGSTLASLPVPTDARVTLRLLPERTVAVIRYSGTWSQSRYAEQLQALRAALALAGLRWHGEPQWARYDPPWMPWFLRRNEVWLELD
jgi:hypothetical protein